MPWKISEQDGKFCVVRKSDGKVVKCHPTRKEANSHIAALYVNEPFAAKKSVGYGMLKSLIEERFEELKGCGANKPGGGGFAAGNTCAHGGKGGGVLGVTSLGEPLEVGDKIRLKNHLSVELPKGKNGVIDGAGPNGTISVKFSNTLFATVSPNSVHYVGPRKVKK